MLKRCSFQICSQLQSIATSSGNAQSDLVRARLVVSITVVEAIHDPLIAGAPVTVSTARVMHLAALVGARRSFHGV